MLTAFTLENFKGVQRPARVEFRPITLLFGPNSAGKSTILHGLHYAYEIFHKNNFDPGRTEWGGESVHLGGFKNVVHRYDLDTSIRMKFEFTLESILHSGIEPLDDLEAVAKSPDDCALEIELRWSPVLRKPILTLLTIEYDGESFAQIEASLDGRNAWLRSFNTEHPMLLWDEDERPTLLDSLNEFLFSYYIEEPLRRGLLNLPLDGMSSALPDWSQSFPLQEKIEEDAERLMQSIPVLSLSKMIDLIEGVAKTLRSLLFLPIASLRHELEQFTYIGPIRTTPPRNYSPARSVQHGRWASGLAAWDALFHGSDSLVKEVSRWLSKPELLHTGYELSRERVVEIPEYLQQLLLKRPQVSELARDLLRGGRTRTRLTLHDIKQDIDVLPQDVGVGISQLIPVVVGAFYHETGILAVEQPEIHVHPALQVRLGDLLIAQTKKEKRFLIETHSEQLLLRLFRRIRETSEEELDDSTLSFQPYEIAVNFITMSERGGTQIQTLAVDHTGDIRGQWPKGFFDERDKELFG